MVIDYPRLRTLIPQHGTQAMILALDATLPAQPARGGVREGRCHPRRGSDAHCYAFPSKTEVVTSNAIITGIVHVCHIDASILFDPGSTYSYMSSCIVSYLDMTHDSLAALVYMSTPVGDSVVVHCVYRSCVVSIRSYETRVDLLLLNMMDFYGILGMDWLSSYHGILDCHAMTMTLAMSSLPWLKRKGSLGHIPSRVVSFLKAQWMVEKRCLAYLPFVRDVNVDAPMVDSVPVVRDIPSVFATDLLGIPSDRDIDFGIDLEPCTQHIFIPLYRMAPVELRESKEQL
ncbi:uncharacterized protein [Nicotiana tomentosiformis]|uniref:uncharacterized protein n=1 Tax=Nicotiana tomentosiformis TaxID=4098 RepID=UPI00388C5F25